MGRKNRQRRPEPFKCCETCANMQPIGEGDHICDACCSHDGSPTALVLESYIPPYSLALDFINKSLELLHPGGLLIFLLNFLESEKRFKWWQEHPLSGLYTLHKRPSFTGRGTDATSYSWFVWERGTGCIGHQTI